MHTRCGRAVFRCVVCHFALTCVIFVLCIGAGSSVNRKEKMCDQLLWLMMDFDANDLIRLNASVQRIAIRSFVRVTCCRGGAMATDYHDRAGLCVQWMGKVVLRAQDLLWSRENFKVLMPDGTEEETLRSQCHQRRVKFHYHERYTYKHSSTCDALEVSRRANTWLYLHCFRLGLFAVQYAGMDLAAVLAAVAARRNGHAGGMPHGAMISASDAHAHWAAGERSYLPQLEDEPLFRRITEDGLYSSHEARTLDIRNAYVDTADALGVKPHAAGINGGRRNSVVGVRRGAEQFGIGEMISHCQINHSGRSDHGTRTQRSMKMGPSRPRHVR